MSENKTVPDKESTETEIPSEFQKVVKDFYKDILLVFPEIKYKLSDETIEFLQEKNNGIHIFNHCLKKYPERFFDILYQNEDIFTTDVDTYFLPNIDFSSLWKEDVSENTRKTIWKYLQVVYVFFD